MIYGYLYPNKGFTLLKHIFCGIKKLHIQPIFSSPIYAESILWIRLTSQTYLWYVTVTRCILSAHIRPQPALPFSADRYGSLVRLERSCLPSPTHLKCLLLDRTEQQPIR